MQGVVWDGALTSHGPDTNAACAKSLATLLDHSFYSHASSRLFLLGRSAAAPTPDYFAYSSEQRVPCDGGHLSLRRGAGNTPRALRPARHRALAGKRSREQCTRKNREGEPRDGMRYAPGSYWTRHCFTVSRSRLPRIRPLPACSELLRRLRGPCPACHRPARAGRAGRSWAFWQSPGVVHDACCAWRLLWGSWARFRNRA